MSNVKPVSTGRPMVIVGGGGNVYTTNQSQAHTRRSAKVVDENGFVPTKTVPSRSAPESETIGKYRLVKTIGKGNFAKVKLAKHIPTGRQVAIKIIDKTKLSPTSLQKLFREVRIMKTLDHPNIVKLFEVIESERCLYLVMEYVSGGEVFDYLVANGKMKEKDVRAKFRQIVSAVQYCHNKNIVHRDLKAENLLLDRNLDIKIADFGFSNEFIAGGKLDTFCGSPPYAAPELFQGKKYSGPEVDVWSLGVILYTLTSGCLPFDGQNLKELKERVLKGKYRVPFYMSTDCENLLKKFLVINPAKRTTLNNAMSDSWLNVGYEGDELKPFVEPKQVLDDKRIEVMVGMGYFLEEVHESLSMYKYDESFAAYHLLGLKSTVYEMNEARSNSSLSLASRAAPTARRVVGDTGPNVNRATSSSGGGANARPNGIPRGRSTVNEQRTTPTYVPPPKAGNRAHHDYTTANTPARDVVGVRRSPSTVESTSRDTPTIRSLMNRSKPAGHSDNESSSHESSRRESIKNTPVNAPVSNRFAGMSSTSRRAPLVDDEPGLIPPLAKMAELELSPGDVLHAATPETTRTNANDDGATSVSVDLENQTPDTTNTDTADNRNPFSTPSGRNPNGDGTWSSAPATRHASTRCTHSANAAASKFPRQAPGRSTVHSGNVQDRVPDGAKTPVKAVPPEKPASTGRMTFFNKLSFKFTRR